MRRGNNPQLVVDKEKGEVIGVTLSADFTAEHEWGIKDLQKDFGINEKEDVFGLERRKINKLPPEPNLGWMEVPANAEHAFLAGFYYAPYKRKPLEVYETYQNELRIYKPFRPRPDDPERTLAAAWDEHSFCVISNSKGGQAKLRQIYDAFATLDVCIFLAGGALFENAGLCIAIASRVADNIKQLWFNADSDHFTLKKEVEKSGILKFLEEKGKRYYACRAKRQEDGTIKFWLNPQEQNRYEAGWFTEAQLREWAEDKGPVIKKTVPVTPVETKVK